MSITAEFRPDLEVARGELVSFDLYVYDVDDATGERTPRDMSADTLAFTVRDADDALILEKNSADPSQIEVEAGDGLATLKFVGGDTESLTPGGSYFCDVWVYTPSETVQIIPRKGFTVLQNVHEADTTPPTGTLSTTLSLRQRYAATDTLTEFYVDATLGDDSNAGTASAPLETIGEVYRRFAWQATGQARILVHLAGNGSTQVTYTTQGLWVGGGLMADQNTFAFRGPEMIAFTPATGPSTAALDATPCERVAQDQSTDVAGPRTKLSFATAAPGWTVNDLAGSFLRVKRAGVLLTFEVPITENTTDAIFVDHTGLVGVLLATDTVEIVRPAVKIAGAADAFSSQPLLAIAGNGGARRVYDGTYNSAQLRSRYSTFEKIEFGCIMAEGTGALCFDRCLLGNASNRGHEFRGFSVGFSNTASHTNTLIYSGTSTYAVRRVDQETQVISSFCTDIQVAPPASITVSGFRVGGSINDNGVAGSAQYTAQAPLSVYRTGGTGIVVAGPGSQLQMRQSVGRILGRGNTGFGLAVQWGAIARVRPASNFITGTLGDVKCNVGAAIAWGSASGAFEDAATWNGDFCRLYDFYKDSDQSRVTTRTTTNTSSAAGSDNTAGRAPDITTLDGYSGNATEFLNGAGAFSTPSGGGGTPGDSVTSETSFGIAASAGVATEYSRKDHTHGTPANPVSYGAVTAETSFGLSSSNGVATSVARSDHTHGTPALPSSAVKTGNATIDANESPTIWNGSDLTATLPTAPYDGQLVELRNINSTPLNVAVSGGATLNDTDPLPKGKAGRYRYVTSDTTWYALHDAMPKEFCADASDGDATISGNTTLTGPKFYNNLTVNSGVTVSCDGFPIFVKGKLLNNGTIAADGNNASGQTAGTNTSVNRPLGGGGGQTGGNGGAAGANAGTAGTGSASFGTSTGNGGAGGAGASAAGAAGGDNANVATSTGQAWHAHNHTIMNHWLGNSTSGFTRGGAGGGGGGGGSGAGGGGGGGGNVMQIYAHHIDNRSGTIRSHGGNGGNGSGTGGGGGGGGGGFIRIRCNIYQGTAPSVAGGSGGTGNVAGASGSVGLVIIHRTLGD